MDQTEINEAEWQNPDNWSWGCYRSPRDTRVIVPKQIKWMGWTFNFAQRTASLSLLAMLLLPALIACVAIYLTGQ